MAFASTSIGLTLHAWVIALAGLLVAVALFAYWRTVPAVGPRARWAFSGVRIAVFLLLALMLLDPRSIWRGQRVDAPNVVLLVDRSESMSLPDSGWGKGESRFEVANRSAAAAKRAVEARGAKADLVYFAGKAEFALRDSVRADGQGTDAEAAIGDVARRYEGEHLAAVMLFGDGVDTGAPIVRPPLPDVPVWTVGTGDTLAPDDVRIAGVDYSPVVRAPSRAVVTATVASTGPRPKRMDLRLTERGKVVAHVDTTLAAGPTSVDLRVAVHVTKPGHREFVLSVASQADTEPENNRRDVVIDVEKARTKIVVVDLTPTWELTFFTALIARDPAYDCEVIVSGQRPGAPIGKLKRPEDFVRELVGADAIVLISVDDAFMSPANADAIRRFVTDRGGGLLVFPGPHSVYETASAWERLGDILPLRGHAPFSFTLKYTEVGPGVRASSSPITQPLVPLLSQTEWQDRAPLLGYYTGLTATPAGEVLLGVRGRAVPALVFATAGKGRVAMLAAGPLWRWKFLAGSNGVYDELMSRLVDVLTRGEESGRFVLVASRNVFEAGESPVLHAEILNERLQPVTGVPVRLEVARVDTSGTETPLEQTTMKRGSPEEPRLTAVLDPLPAGRYVVRGSAETGDNQTLESHPLEFRVSTTSVEFQRTPQDHEALVRIARRTGGAYASPSQAADVVSHMDLSPRKVPAVSESVLRATTPLFVVILLLLSVEWLARKRAGMI